MARISLPLLLLLLAQCVSVPLPRSDSAATGPGERALQGREPATFFRWSEDSGNAEVATSGFLTSSYSGLSWYRKWLDAVPSDCQGFAAREYWTRRSYPLFVRFRTSVPSQKNPPEAQSSDSRSPGSDASRPGSNPVERVFVSFRNAGLWISDDGGKTFQIPQDLPVRYRGKKESACDPILYRDVVGVWQHPTNPSMILAVNIQDILLSMDGGHSFKKLEFRGLSHLQARNIFASIAASYDGSGRVQNIFLGTAYNGIKRIRVNPQGLESFWSGGSGLVVSVHDLNQGLPGLMHEPGVIFYEHIQDLRWFEESQSLVALTQFDPGIGLASTANGFSSFKFRRVPDAATDDVAESMDCTKAACLIETNRGYYYSQFSDAPEQPRLIRTIEGQQSVPAPGTDQNTTASDQSTSSERSAKEARQPRDFLAVSLGPFLVHGGPQLKQKDSPQTDIPRPKILSAFYISPTSARFKQDQVFALIDRYHFNAAVIDVKDDFGRLLYGSKLPLAKELKNDRELVPIRALVAKLKKKGIYTIGRQVVFKDLRMYRYASHRNAIRNRNTGGPWTVEGDEQWTDPFSQEVQDYNLAVSKEVLELGFDEVQFDYIRFPSDGPIYQCYFSHAPADAYRTEAIESFLRQARFSLNAPISIDIFGYNAIYRAGAVIGQDVLEMGSAVDFVSPMHYSSHFGTRYLDQYPRSTRVHRLLEIGTERPLRIARGLFRLRPWLQSFPMMNHIWGYGPDYMMQQMTGTLDGGAHGFLFWGPIAEFSLPGGVYAQRIIPLLRARGLLPAN